MEDSFNARRQGPPAPPAIVWAMALAFAALELIFNLGQWGETLRLWAFSHFAFFDLYLDAALAGRSVPPEFWLSFFTYSFLHGGFTHLLFNGVIFLALGGVLANALGTWRFLALFFFASATGALLWGLAFTSQPPGHLVGASGALFGFFGALKRWEWRWTAATGASRRRFWGTIFALILLNLFLAIFGAAGLTVAWEAHLGGFIGGWLIAPVLAPGKGSPSPI